MANLECFVGEIQPRFDEAIGEIDALFNQDPSTTDTFSGDVVEAIFTVCGDYEQQFGEVLTTYDELKAEAVAYVSTRVGRVITDGAYQISYDPWLDSQGHHGLTVDALSDYARDQKLEYFKRTLEVKPYAQRIYKPLPQDPKLGDEAAEWKAPEDVGKYNVVLEVLLHVFEGLELKDLAIVEETLDPNQMRKYPYKIMYVSLGGGKMITIAVSDQLGEQVYVYDGLVDLDWLSHNMKGQAPEGVTTDPVRWGKYFKARLSLLLQQIESGERSYGIITDTEPEFQRLEPGDDRVDSEEISSREGLMSGHHEFPPESLAKLSEEELMRTWVDVQLAKPELIADCGLKERDGAFYLGDFVFMRKVSDGNGGTKSAKMRIGGKTIQGFPSADILRRLGIIKSNEKNYQKAHKFGDLLKYLGYDVVSEEAFMALDIDDRVAWYEAELQEALSEFEAVESDLIAVHNLKKRNGSYYLGDFVVEKTRIKSAGSRKLDNISVKIGGKPIGSFTTPAINRRLEVIDQDQRVLQTSLQFEILLERMGCEVVSEEAFMALPLEERIAWYQPELDQAKADFVLAKPALIADYGLKERGTQLFLGDFRLCNTEKIQREDGTTRYKAVYAKVGGRNIMTLVSCDILRRLEVLAGDTQSITNPTQLGILLKLMGYDVVSEEDFMALPLEDRIAWCREELDQAIEAFEAEKPELIAHQGLKEQTGVLFLGDFRISTRELRDNGKKAQIYIKIGDRSLKSFPSTSLLRYLEVIGQDRGDNLRSKTQFKALLECMDYTVLSEEDFMALSLEERISWYQEELDQACTDFEAAKLQLISDNGLREKDGVFYLGDFVVRSYQGSSVIVPEIGGKCIESFPSTSINRRLEVIEPDQVGLKNPEQFARLLQRMGKTVSMDCVPV